MDGKSYLWDENHVALAMSSSPGSISSAASGTSSAAASGGGAAGGSGGGGGGGGSGVPCPCHGFFGKIELCPAVVAPGSKHPAWSAPSATARGGGIFKGLRVNNSLTGTMVDFRPAHGNQVTWYTCGPTVYDVCHMGHARAYLTLDILRRITEDYFGYDVLYHVNITDVDDKIILRARQQHLLDQWKAKTLGGGGSGGFAEVAREVAAALQAKAAKLAKGRAALEAAAPAGSDVTSREVEDHAAAVKGHALKEAQLSALDAKVQAALDAKAQQHDASAGGAAAAAEALVALAAGELGELLDGRHGAGVEKHAVFDAHSRRFEASFFEDMGLLGVRPPDVLTRVTEYVPQIANYVAAIVAKGLAYPSPSGSVYLSIDAFKAAGHTYRKLKPFNGLTSAADMAEGEGALGGGEAGGGGVPEKRHPNDFALWKASKPGEPWWESPWGKGRPGWHIECSVVASDILGPNIDVHAGGVDLKFPHHDNELAQSEAFYGHGQWVNYFFHAGHLDIKGLKMSKSLKNFITIKQALEKHSARQIRLMFLLQPWDRGMNYSDQEALNAKAKEALFRNFFGTVKALLTETEQAAAEQGATEAAAAAEGGGGEAAAAAAGGSGQPAWLSAAKGVGWQRGAADRALAASLASCGDAVHEALCANFDTPAVLAALAALVKDVNQYLGGGGGGGSEKQPAVSLLRKCALKVTQVLKLLGVVEGSDDLGFPLPAFGPAGGGAGGGGAGGGGTEALLRPYLDTLKDFRQEVRGLMRGGSGGSGGSGGAAVMNASGAVLSACDRVRDEALPKLGVRLEDRSDGSSLWKLDDPEVLLREQEEKRAAAAAARAAAAQKKVAAAQKKLDDALRNALKPEDLFRLGPRAAEFKAWDAEGVPTVLADGGEVTKSAAKKLKKDVAGQAKAREKVLKECAKAGGVAEGDLEGLIAKYRADLAAALKAANGAPPSS